MAVKPIALSFKDDPEDLELYKWIKGHSGMSGFIKDILRGAKGNEKPKDENKNYETNRTELIDMDF